MMRALLSRLRAVFLRRELDARLDEEVQGHLEALAADYERRGATRDEARRAARRAFGGVEQMKEMHRDQRSLPWADALRQDVTYAARQLRQRPGLALVCVCTLALSMASAIAVFTVVDGVLLRPLSYPEPDRLVVAHSRMAQFGRVPVSDAQYDVWRGSVRSIEEMALLWAYSVNLAGSGEPERVPAARVSPELFEILGSQPQLGRLLRRDEDQPGRDRVVIISDGLWRRRFNADRTVVGRTISVNGVPHEIVGVLTADFRFPRISRLYSIPVDADRPDVWKPLALAPNDPLRGLNFTAIARLSRGATIAQAQSELDALQRTLVPTEGPGRGNATIPGELTPLHDQITGGSRRGLEVLPVAVFRSRPARSWQGSCARPQCARSSPRCCFRASSRCWRSTKASRRPASSPQISSLPDPGMWGGDWRCRLLSRVSHPDTPRPGIRRAGRPSGCGRLGGDGGASVAGRESGWQALPPRAGQPAADRGDRRCC